MISENVRQTQKIAKDFVNKLLCPKQGLGQGAVVVGLSGELGSGKTTFVQAFAKALGIKTKVVSPTFVLMKNYALRVTRYSLLVHIDAYRIKDAREILDLGWKEMVENPENVILIEWPENIKKILPKNCIKIRFKHANINKRKIIIT